MGFYSKGKLFLFFAILLTAFRSHATNVGSGQSYTTLKAAFDAINNGTLRGNIVLDITSDLTETASAILNASGAGAASYSSVLIRPKDAARTISGSFPGTTSSVSGTFGVITLNGANNVTIDGRINGTGNAAGLTIKNTNTAIDKYNYAMMLRAGSGYNTFKYITFQCLTSFGNNTTTYSKGIVAFYAITGAAPVRNNTVEYCNFDGQSSLSASAGLVMNGECSDNLVSNTNFYNITGIGVVIYGAATANTVRDNSFYVTYSPFTASANGYAGILVQATGSLNSSCNVLNNWVGGMAPFCGGQQPTITARTVFAITVQQQRATIASEVQGNRISNLKFNIEGSANLFAAIYISLSRCNVGTTTPNIVGSGTSPGNIVLNTAANVTTTPHAGINMVATADMPGTVANNQIGGIIVNTNTPSIAGKFHGINTSGGSPVIRNNFIGSATVPNSIQNNSGGSTTVNFSTYGIATSGSAIVENNTVMNISATAADSKSRVAGIYAFSSNSGSVSGNSVKEITSSSTSDSEAYTDAALAGISATGGLVSGNEISNLYQLENAAATKVFGIRVGQGQGGITERNKVYHLVNNSSSENAKITGIDAAGGSARNNLVYLGFKPNGNSVPGPVQLYGLSFNASSRHSAYNNSVYIGGTNAGQGGQSAALYVGRGTWSSIKYQNNILVNNRSSLSGDAKQMIYFMENANTSTEILIDNNIYQNEGTGNFFALLGTDQYSKFSYWRTSTSRDLHGGKTDPLFIDTQGDLGFFDLHLQHVNPAEGRGAPLTEITQDYDGNPRNPSTPDIGADEGDFVRSQADLFPPVIMYTDIPDSPEGAVLKLDNFADIRDDSNLQGSPLPRLYFKKATGQNVFADNTSAVDGWKYVTAKNVSSPYSFEIEFGKLKDGSVIAGDVIQYFVAAEDNAGNLSSYPPVAGSDAEPLIENINAADLSRVKSFTVTARPAASVSSIVLDAENMASGTVDFIASFSEAVADVDAADFSLHMTGTVTATIGTPVHSGTNWRIPLSGVAGKGTLRLDFTGITTVNPNIGAVFTGGDVYTVNTAAMASTGGASDISGTAAKLSATVNDGGAATSVKFAYGTDPSLSAADSVSSQPSVLPPYAGSVPVAASLTGLNPGTTYYYRVKAVNSAGVTLGDIRSFTTLSDNARLASLTLSTGNLEPEFSTAVSEYSVSVPNATTSLSLTPAAAHAGATIKVQNTGVTSGYTSGMIPLNTGINTININLTAEDGITGRLYTLTVNRDAAPVTVSLSGSVSRVYNGGHDVQLSAGNYVLNGAGSSDEVTVSGTAAFDNEQAGSGKLVTVSGLILSGADASKYRLTSTSASGAIGEITPKPVAVSLTGTSVKTYNKNTDASLSASNYLLSGLEAGDQVSVSGSASYQHPDVGTGITVSVSSLIISGADAANYNIANAGNSVSGVIGEIKPKVISAALRGSALREYNGSNTASLTALNYTLNGLESGDEVFVSAAEAVYDNKKAGAGKTVTVSGLSLSGAGAGNYNLSDLTASAAIGEIKVKPLTVMLTGSAVKSYDGGLTAILAASNYLLRNVEDGDKLTVDASASYDSKTVGTGKTVTASSFTLSGDDAGNYSISTITADAPIGEITPKEIRLSLNAAPEITKVYDGSTAVSLVAANFSLPGAVPGDGLNVSGKAVFNTGAVGSGKTITVSDFILSGAAAGNYRLLTTEANTSGAVTPKPVSLTLNAVPLITKVYDGSASAALTPANYFINGVEEGDDLQVSGSATYADHRAGTGKRITASGFNLSGPSRLNYTLSTSTAYTTGDIIPKSLTVSLRGVAGKVYDKTTAASLSDSNYLFEGLENDDIVSLSGTAVYQDSRVGDNIPITVTGLDLSGSDAGNYHLGPVVVSGNIGKITPKPVAPGLTGTVSKTYNGSKSVVLTAGNYTLSDVEEGDDLHVSGTANFDTKAAGTGKTVLLSDLVLSGADVANYSLSTNTANADIGEIRAKPLTARLQGPVVKHYDATTAADVNTSEFSFDGLEEGDILEINGKASFDTKHSGTAKNVTVEDLELSGADAGNYTLTSGIASAAVGEIKPANITVSLSELPLISKPFDGLLTAVLSPENYKLEGLREGDDVAVTGTAVYNSAGRGTAKPVSVSNFVLSGTSSADYILLTTSANTTGIITGKAITLFLNADPLISKEYDGSRTAILAPGNFTLEGVEGGDDVIVSGTAEFRDKNAGTGKEIVAGNFVLEGPDRYNYTLTTRTAVTVGEITAKKLTLALNEVPAISKVYDGNTTATLKQENYVLAGVEPGDLVSVSGSAVYADRHVGLAKEIRVDNLSLGGSSASNYQLITPFASTTGSVRPKGITLAIRPEPLISKVYDGQASAFLAKENYVLEGVEADDVVEVSGKASYENKQAGAGKTIRADDFLLGGPGKNNYTLTTLHAETSGEITPKNITLSLRPLPLISRGYNGSASAMLASQNYVLEGLENGDHVSVSGTALFDDKHAGTGKPVIASQFALDGFDKTNYNLTTVSASTTGNITAKHITLTLSSVPAVSKVYDGNTQAVLSDDNYILAGLESGDELHVRGNAKYAAKNAGTAITVNAKDFVLEGASAPDYSLVTLDAATTGTIRRKDITVELNALPAITKVYDGSVTALPGMNNYVLHGVEAGDNVNAGGSAQYSDKHSGERKTVTATSFVLAGEQKENYNLTTVSASTTGSITPKNITLSLSAQPPVVKIYDGNADIILAEQNYVLTGVQTVDDVKASGSAFFADKNVGASKQFRVENFILSGADQANYRLTTISSSGTGAVTKRLLTVTADDKRRFQGTANPQLTVSYSGFAPGDDVSSLIEAARASTSAVPASAIGTYPITASGAIATNYAFTYIPGSLAVTAGAPNAVIFTAAELSENAGPGALAGLLGSTSDDPEAVFTYSLVQGRGDADNNLFVIVGNEIRTTAVFNYEEKNVYTVRVRSTTQHDLWLEQQITIAVRDVNEQPTLDIIADQTICITSALQIVPLTGISAGEDAGQSVSLKVTSSNTDFFRSLKLIPNGGDNAYLEYTLAEGVSGKVGLTVTVLDNGGTAHNGVDAISRSFTLSVNTLPEVKIRSDKGLTLSKGDVTELTAGGALSYRWESAEGIQGSVEAATITLRPSKTATYKVTGTNASGCSSEAFITITVDDDFQMVRGTNILSPNGDGQNDRLIIRNSDMYPDNELKIYDRAGRQLYSQKNYADQWDGTFNGLPLAEDTYYYIVSFSNGRTLKGYVTIVKD